MIEDDSPTSKGDWTHFQRKGPGAGIQHGSEGLAQEMTGLLFLQLAWLRGERSGAHVEGGGDATLEWTLGEVEGAPRAEMGLGGEAVLLFSR